MPVWRRGVAYSQDLRDRVLAADGLSARAVAERYGVSISYVIKARQRRDRLGERTPGAQRSHVKAKLAEQDAALSAQVARQPDATLAELREWALRELGICVSITALWRRLRGLGLTFKKSVSSPPSRPAPMWRRRARIGRS